MGDRPRGVDSTHEGPDGQLYVCTAPNTWSFYYKPYTYPHPLVADHPGSVKRTGKRKLTGEVVVNLYKIPGYGMSTAMGGYGNSSSMHVFRPHLTRSAGLCCKALVVVAGMLLTTCSVPGERRPQSALVVPLLPMLQQPSLWPRRAI